MGKKLIIAFILAIGIFLRLWQLNSLPGGLFLDEVNMAVDAKSLAQQGTDQYGRSFPFYFEDATDFKLPLYIYATSLAYKVFGNQIITVHITSALAGIVSIFLLGYLSYLLFPEKKYLPLYAMSILALSPFAIHFSRIGYETNLGLMLLLIYLIALVKVLRGKSPGIWLVLGGVAVILADWTYPSPRFIIPVFTFCLIVISWVLRFVGIEKRHLKQSVVFLGAAVFSFLPTLFFPFADERQLALIQIVKGQTILQTVWDKAIIVLASWIRLWNIEFLFDKGDQFAYRHGTKEMGIFLPIFIIPFFLGIWMVIKNFSRKNFALIFLVLFALVAGLPSALTYPVPYGTRVVPMLIPYTLLLALGSTIVSQWIAKQKYLVKTILILIIATVLLYQTAFFSYIYFVHFQESSVPEFPTAPVTLAQYVTSFRTQHPATPIYFLTDRECHPWGNDALYLWYFAGLSNKEMIAWNITYRTWRYTDNPSSPFSAYEDKGIIAGFVPSANIYLYPTTVTQSKAPTGSLLIHCGIELTSYDTHKEALQKVIYAYPPILRDPYYVITAKR